MFVDDILDFAARKAPAEIALHCGGETVTFAELLRRVEARVEMLTANAAPGDRIAVLSENRTEFVELLYAVPRAAMVLVPLNYRLHAEEWTDQLTRVEATILFAERDLLARFEGRLDTVGSLRTVVDLDQPATAPTPHVRRTTRSGSDQRSDADIAWLLFTSGTTGRPKGAMLTHRSLVAGVTSGSLGRRVAPHDVSLFAFPLCHIAAYNVLIHHFHARPVVVMRRFDAGEFLELVPRLGVTTTTLAPTMIDLVLEHPGLAQTDLSGLRAIGYGASPIPASVLRRGFERIGCDFSQGYGMTELSGNAVFLDEAAHRAAADGDDRTLRAAGRPTPVVAVRVVDDDMNDVAAPGTGEIVVRGDQVMAGYWRDEEATAAAFAGGWFHTGDLGRLDPDGLLSVVDRKKDVIVTGGENVASREVEQMLETLPGVREVAVVGVPDETWGENVCAVVVRTDDDLGAALTAEAVVAHARAHLAGYKKPKVVHFVDALPKNANGKVEKPTLRATMRELTRVR